MRGSHGRPDVIAGSAGGATRRPARVAGIVLLLASGATLSLRSVLAGDRAYGAYLAAECASCHASTAANGAIPPLHLLPYDRLVEALQEYRDGTRANAVMQSVARSLGDAEIAALAAYFSGRS